MQARAFNQINIIDQNAERELLSAVERAEQQQTARGGLHFFLSQLEQPIQIDGVLGAIEHLIEDRMASVYILDDGDIIIAWSGTQMSVLGNLTKTIYSHFQLPTEEGLHKYYDLNAHAQALQAVLKAKLQIILDRQKQAPAPAQEPECHFSADDLENIAACSKERHTLPQPIVLVVASEEFSQTSITRMLKDDAMCYTATTHQEAIQLYGELVPNMMVFDAEHDKSMWDLASYIKRSDPGSFLVAILGSNFKNDAEKAKDAKIQAAVIRPFSRDKLLETVRKYMNSRQK